MKLYRYEEFHSEHDVKLILVKFSVLRSTPQGFWIAIRDWKCSKNEKWVSANSRKRFAYPTETEALTNYRFRKYRHISILRWRLDRAEMGLAEAERMRKHETNRITKGLQKNHVDRRL